jgi:hypothetical protein
LSARFSSIGAAHRFTSALRMVALEALSIGREKHGSLFHSEERRRLVVIIPSRVHAPVVLSPVGLRVMRLATFSPRLQVSSQSRLPRAVGVCDRAFRDGANRRHWRAPAISGPQTPEFVSKIETKRDQ